MVPVNGSGEPSIPPASPSQRHKGQCTRSEEVQCLRIGCSAPINKNKRGIDRSIDATTTSKLHEGRRRVELNREISRRANPLLFSGRRATADPGCGTRGRRQGLAGLRDRSLRAEGSRVAISRAGRRPRVHQAAGPARPTPPAPGKQPGRTVTSTATSTTTGAQATRLRPRSGPSARSPDTLTASRPRS